MKTVTAPIGKIFGLLEAYEKIKFVPEQEQYLNSDLYIQDENSEWVLVNAAITKEASGRKIEFNSGDSIKAADKHLIFNGNECVHVDSLTVGDRLIKGDGSVIEVTEIDSIPDTVFYDLSVISDSHLYQTANGIIHHNTELCKLLSENLGMKLLRYDMSEYMEKHSAARLIGAPPGYVGFDDGNVAGGLLVSDISRNPNSIVLFDEIEKAHPDVMNVLLSLMDEGMITGSNGKKADARNSIIIMTSNLGASDAERNSIGFGSLERSGEDDKAVKEFFKPEFRNRLDAVVKFNKMSPENIRLVVAKMMMELNDLLLDKGIKLELAESAVDVLVQQGFDSKMGARPMARTINNLIKSPLSRKIVFEKLGKGVIVKVDADENGTIRFTVNDNNNPVGQDGIIRIDNSVQV